MFNKIYSPINNLIINDIEITHNHNTKLCSNSAHFEIDNTIYLVPRIEDHSKQFASNDNFWIDHSDNICLKFDNNTNKIVNSFSMNIDNINHPIYRVEHFRFFKHNDAIYSNHSMLTPKASIETKNISIIKSLFDKPMLSKLDLESSKLIVQNNKIKLSDIKTKDFERNWSFYSNNCRIFVLYSIQPFILFYSEDVLQKFNLAYQKNYNIKWDGYSSNNAIAFRNSCNPIEYEDHLLMFFHLRDKLTSLYYYGICILDKKTLQIRKFSKIPILYYNEINENFPRWSNLYYLMSIRNNNYNNTLELFGGKSHRVISKIVLDKTILNYILNDEKYTTIM